MIFHPVGNILCSFVLYFNGDLCFPSWHAIIVDGHSVEELCKVLSQPRHQPLAIIAKTIKGKGIPGTVITHTNIQISCFVVLLKCQNSVVISSRSPSYLD